MLHGGRVITLDAAEPDDATAVLVRGGRVEIVGQDAEVLAASRAVDRKVDLDGAVVVPGLADSHCHLYGLGKSLVQIDLRGIGSATACAELVAAAAAEATPGTWLEGRGWDQNDWPEAAWPDRALLDAAGGGRPVYLRRVDGHAAWVSSATLAAAGITAATVDPAGGLIMRDEAGEPTGILVDNAVDLVRDVVPEPTLTERRRRVRMAVEHCLAHGITAVHDAGISWESVGLYREMAATGELGLRYYGMLNDEPETLESGFAAGPVAEADGMLTVRTIKLYADGALGSRGALLLADYSDEPGSRGLAVTARAHMDSMCRRAAAGGFQVGTHAIGDAANRLVLDIYAEVFAELGAADRRWRVEHAQILGPADIPRFAELGVIAAMQPVHCTSDMDWAHERLGAERLAGAYAWRSLLEADAHVCSGTDFPVERVSALAGLYASRTRTHPDGSPLGGWQPQEKLDGLTALELYTAGSAYAAFAENELGRIIPGYRADLTVLDGDPVACEPADLLDMQVLMTVVDGEVRYENPALESPAP
ncbi:MAG: amidohydrolase [bacterium]|nr:amidohydrolase [bacterium]